MDTAPKLGTKVVVTAEAHPRQNDVGECVGYHGHLTDCVYVSFPDGVRSDIIPLAYLEEVA